MLFLAILPLLVLAIGVILMGCGGSFNRKHSGKLMAARVITQGFAVAAALVYYASKG